MATVTDLEMGTGMAMAMEIKMETETETDMGLQRIHTGHQLKRLMHLRARILQAVGSPTVRVLLG